MLPVGEQPASGDIASFAGTPNPRRDVRANVVPPLNPMLLGLLIGGAIRASKDSAYNSLSDAVASVPLSSLTVFTSHFEAELLRGKLQLERISDPQIAERLRSDDYKNMPLQLDGILDAQLYNTGYYDLGRGRGFAPYLYIYARILDLVNVGEIAEEWSYNGTLDKSEEGTHNYFMSPSLVQPDLGSFERNASVIKAEFTSLLERAAEQLARDILSFQASRANSLPRP